MLDSWALSASQLAAHYILASTGAKLTQCAPICLSKSVIKPSSSRRKRVFHSYMSYGRISVLPNEFVVHEVEVIIYEMQKQRSNSNRASWHLRPKVYVLRTHKQECVPVLHMSEWLSTQLLSQEKAQKRLCMHQRSTVGGGENVPISHLTLNAHFSIGFFPPARSRNVRVN
jgi:hypothetical protein